MRKAVILQVYGRVQGVGFRYYTQRKANELGIFGFIQNKGDGSVYIEAEGEEEILNVFVAWCHQGPQWAKVQDIIISDVPALMRNEFIIR
ncbi:MAG: acylphosphatase [Ignavibacteria bacterium]|nr:acylphosphatase [Ignavibacteria bacterium]